MRIIFSVCGIGMGHSLRSYRLMQYLSKDDHELYVITSGDGALFFKDKEYPSFNIRSLDFEWGESGLSIQRSVIKGVRSISVFKEHYLFERSVVNKLSPDVIVSDSRGAPLVVAKQFDIPSILITNQLSLVSNRTKLDKLIAHWMPKFWSLADKIIIPDLPPPYTITYRNNVYPLGIHDDIKKKLVFTGLLIDYKTLSFSASPYSERKYDVFIFISAPSVDRKLYSLSMLRIAKKIRKRFKTIMSIGDPLYKDYSIKLGSLDFFGWMTNPLDMLKKSKVVVLRGGQTAIMEAILSNTPMVVIPAKNQTEQIENARRVDMLGLGIHIPPDVFYKDPDSLDGALEKIFINYSYYSKNIKHTKKHLLSAGGVEKAASLVEYLSIH